MKHKVRNVLAVVRRCLALVFFLGITLLLCDFTGVLHTWLGWMAKVQLLPAVLALNFVTVAVLVILTLIFGRVYCSVICPLGVMQDLINRLSASRKGKKYRLSYSPAKNWLRYGLLALFVMLFIFTRYMRRSYRNRISATNRNTFSYSLSAKINSFCCHNISISFKLKEYMPKTKKICGSQQRQN